MIELNCGECGKVLRVADRYRGQSGRCNGCGAIVHVPSLDATAQSTETEEDFIVSVAQPLTDRFSDSPIHNPTQAPSAPPVIYDRNFKLGLLGSITLLIGVFAPIFSVPIIGSINYLGNGKGDGMLVLVLALISFALVFLRKFKALWITGLASTGIMLFTIVSFQIRIAGIKDELQTDSGSNLFAGMMDAMATSAQLQWGWVPLIVGSGLLIASAAIKEKTGESSIEFPKGQVIAIALHDERSGRKTKYFGVLLGVGLGIALAIVLVIVKPSILSFMGIPSPAAPGVSNLSKNTRFTTETGQLNENSDSQVISEIEAIEKELGEIAELKLFDVVGARFYFAKNTFSDEPVIELTVLNKTAYPVSKAHFYGTLKSPGRSIPWLEEEFSYEIRGGLEPGEQATWKLAPNIFGDWAEVPKNRNDMILYVQTTGIDGADGEPIIDFVTNDDYNKREFELNTRLAELQKVLPGYTPAQRSTPTQWPTPDQRSTPTQWPAPAQPPTYIPEPPATFNTEQEPTTHIPEPPVAIDTEPGTTTPTVTGIVYSFDGEYHASKNCSKITGTPGMLKGEAALERHLNPCEECY
jgi:hypothetical protein